MRFKLGKYRSQDNRLFRKTLISVEIVQHEIQNYKNVRKIIQNIYIILGREVFLRLEAKKKKKQKQEVDISKERKLKFLYARTQALNYEMPINKMEVKQQTGK